MFKKMNEEMVERFLELISQFDMPDEDIIEVSTVFFSQAMSKAEDVFEQLVFYHTFKKFGLLEFLDESFSDTHDEALELLDEIDDKVIKLIKMQWEDSHEGDITDEEVQCETPDNVAKAIVIDCFVEALTALYGETYGDDFDGMAQHFVELKYTNPVQYEEDNEFVNEFMFNNLPEGFSEFSFDVVPVEKPQIVTQLIESIECSKKIDVEQLGVFQDNEEGLKLLRRLIKEGKTMYEAFELKIDELSVKHVQ